ncbi:MAG: hypothetical protein U1E76_10740 [Planctomycetota bacterium]
MSDDLEGAADKTKSAEGNVAAKERALAEQKEAQRQAERAAKEAHD